jgi:3'(2'), 5'-bisphosphate nucleotidase
VVTGDETDHLLARRLAHEAGDLVMDYRAEVAGKSLPLRTVKDEADRRANRLLVDRLRSERPDDAVLSEEEVDDLARLDAERVWIVDPVDGTREFGEGRDDFAVHVALWAGGELVAGAVALPAPGLVLDTLEPPTLAELPDRPRLVVSRSRPPVFASDLARALGADIVVLGSAGAKAMAVVRGLAHVYVQPGALWEWDSAAPVAVARAAGAVTCRMDGSPLAYNQPDPRHDDLLVCHPALAEQVLSFLADSPDRAG